MASEDATLLGKRISQLNPIPQDWSEEQVVELITNGLIPLAKSNYDTFKITLGFAFGYIPSWKNYSTKNGSSGGDNSIYIGKSTVIGNNSISLGDNNNGGNRVISLGFGNTNVDRGVCNFANIGYNNLIYNKVSEIRKYNDNDELESLPTQSFVAGVANKSRHYNDIILGYGNESLQAESVEQGEPFNDDGFCIALGFKNLVGRNYDIAIGHKSVANGGENIALQHSNAVGYRNLAMFGSNVNGTCNIASCDSNIDIYYPDNQGNKITNYVTYNIFHNSYVYHRRSENTSGEYSYNRNIILHASFKTESDCFQQNFIYGGYGLSDEGDESIFKSKLVSNNIALDTSMFKIEATTILKKNVFFQNNNIWANALTFYDNVYCLTNTNITSSKHIFRNNISHASIQGTVGLFHNNTIRNSDIYLSDDDINSDYSGFNFNVILSNSSATFTREKSFWDGSKYYSMSSNFLFGANAQNTYGCFAMSDGVGLAIKNSNYTFVFGDNTVEQTTSCVVFGQNNIKRAINLTVFGRSNEIDCAYNDNTSLGSNVVSDGIVVGNRNIIKSYKKSYNTIGRLSVVGAGNSIICNNAHGIFITGDENKLQTIIIVELTGAQIRQKQIDKEFVGHFKVNDFDVGYELNSNSGEIVDYSGYWWGAYDYYYYYDNGIIAQYNPSDITDAGYSAPTYTSITATNFINNLANGNVQNKTYWKISGSVDVPDNVHLYKGVFLIPTYSYGFYNNYGYYYLYKVGDGNYNSADISYLNSYITISGEDNVVSSNVIGYTVFGMSNTVKNTFVNVAESDWCISNGFVQGNNNDVSNGSNIIVMGNGNKAEGHNSVSIGMQLISKQWQTVIGKYNVSIDGTTRIIPRFDSGTTYSLGDKVINTNDNRYYEYISNASSSGSWVDSKWKEINPDDDKAIFIIGNGYSEKDNSSWQDEQYIHRSNAMVVYGDGTVKAHDFKADVPLNKLPNGGALVDASVIDVPNNKYVTLETYQTSLTLNVNLEQGYVANFLVEIEANSDVVLSVTSTLNGVVTPLKFATNGGNTLENGKIYQVSCCGDCWVLAEFNRLATITNIQTDNLTSGSVDIKVTGTDLSNNFSYILELDLDGTKLNVTAEGDTTTLDGNNFTNYSNAEDVACTPILNGVRGSSYKLKGNPLIIGGRLYKTVKIGNQTWMAENLDYVYSGLSLNNSTVSYSKKQADYYDYDEATYSVSGNKYGLLYNYPAAKYINDNKSTICPGWHVPSFSDWETLFNTVGGVSNAGTKLKSSTDWVNPYIVGTDDYGFNAKPAGEGYPGNNDSMLFINLGTDAFFMTMTNSSFAPEYVAHVVRLESSNGQATDLTGLGKNGQVSIRLVKD